MTKRATRGAGGYVRKVGTKYEARWYDPDGKQRGKRFPTKAAAVEFAATQQIDARKSRDGRGSYTDPRRKAPLFKNAALDWLDTSPGKAPKTRLGYASIVHQHLIPAFGSTRVEQISVTDVARFRARMEKAGKAAGTIKSYLRVLSPILDLCIDDGHLVRNPCKRVTVKGGQSKRATIIKPTQVRLVASLIDPHYATLVLFTAYTGLRPGEIAALRWRHIDLDKLSINVESSVTELSVSEKRRALIDLGTEDKLYYGPTKSNRGRTIRFPSFLVPLLEAIRPTQDDVSNVLLFRTAGHAPMRWDNFRHQRWLPAIKKAHKADPTFPERLRFYDLRHTCASVLIDRDYNPKAIQAHMGHSSIQVTFDIYGHLFDDWHDEVPNVLDEVYREAPLFMIPGEASTPRTQTKKSA
ncbi:MAG: hypothetical protein QOD92_440 [Acidimicrobiaceae bacterium]|jgi:integrase